MSKTFGSSHVDELKQIATHAIDEFSRNAVICAIKAKQWTRDDYERLLLTIFPQVHQGTMSFALAAGNCANKWSGLREFLVHHADEEMIHYKWIADDLKSIGYKGAPPEHLLPSPPTQAYICFNFFNAHHLPPSRLASSVVLEGLGASLTPTDYAELFQSSGLRQENFSFFISHSSTDKGHILELWDMIESLDMKDLEWRWVKHACRTAGAYYKAMYDYSMVSLRETPSSTMTAARVGAGGRHA